jgi:PhnB protein
MTTKVKPIPDGYHTLTPYLIVKDGAEALEFYAKAFGAVEKFRMAGPDGKIHHAEMTLGNSVFMLADEHLEINAKSPEAYGGSPISLMAYVEDVDAIAKRAIDAGVKVIRPVEDQFYGDRSGMFEDPFGHIWMFSTHIKDVTAEEMAKLHEGKTD